MEQIEQNNKVDNRSASQKIADLENGIMSLYQTVGTMARDLMTVKDILKVLNNKVGSIVKASASGQAITDEVISKIMIDNTVEDLKNRLRYMVAEGRLKAVDQADESSFLAGIVETDAGEVVNPRLQFVVNELSPLIKEKCKGAKVGDGLAILEESNLVFRVQEIYAIQSDEAMAQAAQAAQAPAAPAESLSSEAAPAASEPAAAPVAQPDQSVTAPAQA
jgi:hypothetical protein